MNDAAGLYVHIPFCSAICPYCDFAVIRDRAERREAFVQSLLCEIDRSRPAPWRFDTVYFGGGTPSAMTPEQLARILTRLRESFEFVPGTRVSLEANPEDVSESSVAAWQELSVDTLSLGVQSFDAAELRFLGRRHDPARARDSVAIATGSFRAVSVDLIYGLPAQSLAVWEESLRTAAGLAPDHISCYQLTVHPGTPFARRRAAARLVELSDEEQAECFLATHRVLPELGFEPYEVSNFSRGAEYRSAHNLKYWNHTPYLGIGPSAHSFDGRRRWWNARDLGAYETALAEGRSPVDGDEELSDRDLALEALALRLRTTDGIDIELFAQRYGVDLRSEPHRTVIERWIGNGFASLAANQFRLTPAGLAIADAVARSIPL